MSRDANVRVCLGFFFNGLEINVGMINRAKNVWNSYFGGLDSFPAIKDGEISDRPPLKFRYTRPTFLQLVTDDEVQVSADHVIRPIIVPRDITKLPWNSGYAE